MTGKNVYVIRLRRAVWKNEPRFRRKNPNRRWWRPCVYVGSTRLTPEQRFRKHLEGGKTAAKYPKRYGVELMDDLFEDLNPVPAKLRKL